MALLFDPDLTTATGFILFISSFINILTNFSFFSSVVLSISHHSLFFSHRVMLLTPLAPVAAHPGSHCKTQATQRHCNNTVSVWPGFYFTVDTATTPSSHPSPCSPVSLPGSSGGGFGFVHSPAVSAAARSFSSPAEGSGAAG